VLQLTDWRRSALRFLSHGLVWSFLIGTSCRFTGNHPVCRQHTDAASCGSDERCFPEFHCATSDKKPGRCLTSCVPYNNGTCRMNSSSHPDACLPDLRGGRFQGCIATDKDPSRCEPGPTGADGNPICIDRHAPCAACNVVFDFCEAHCTGILCF
jgi:hypothetical protein